MNSYIKFSALFVCVLACVAMTANLKTPWSMGGTRGETFHRIGLSAALELHQTPQTLFVDARLGESFQKGHIAGSVSILSFSANDSPELLARFKLAPNVVLYGGRNKSEAYHALNALSRMKPLALSYYEAGWPEWSHLKLPINP
jgi:3-mercaptopyruvate sulfurtransferase SseA